MNLCVRFVRGLSIAGFVLGGIVLSVAAVGLAARLAVLQAAHFMISVLEMMPHV
jgi:hypothetical protein